jgi:hypothetical protein
MDKLPKTIKTTSNFFCIFHQRADRLEQLNHFQKISVFFTKEQVA